MSALEYPRSYSHYECSVVVNDYKLLGVQDVSANYGISESPIRAAGVGFIDALISSPLQGNIKISRKMVSTDPLLEKDSLDRYLIDEKELTGAILYDNEIKSFGFTKGRVSSYSVSCNAGEIPNVDMDIIVYGDLGKNINNQSATKTHPSIRYPDQSSIRVKVSDFSIDAVQSFSYSRTIKTVPVYGIPKGTLADWENEQASTKNLDPIQVDTEYPIETDIGFTLIADKYEIREIKDRIQSAPKSDVSIEIYDPEDSSIINSFLGKNIRLIGESINSTVDEEMNVSLNYKGYETYHNIL